MKSNRSQVKINLSHLNLFIILDENFIYGIHWKKQAGKLIKKLELDKKKLKLLNGLEVELLKFFDNQLTAFKTPIVLEGTPFQLRVWAELKKIPYGKTISYQDLARRLRSPSAARAVGGANSKNPVSIIVPCHRVIRADGSIGGYAGGVATKRKILNLELGKA